MGDLSKLAEALEKGIGANDEAQGVDYWVSTGYPALDRAISHKYVGGGFPSGRMIEIAGPPSSGKTAIATNVMKAAQELGGIAQFHDHERSFEVGLAEKFGMSTVPGHWIYKRPKTFEESLDMAVETAHLVRGGKYIPDEAPIVVVFDSLASMIPKSKRDKKSAEFNMHDNTALARCTSAAFPTFADFASEFNMLVIFLNQTREDINVKYGDKTKTPGGNAPGFYCSVRIMLKASLFKNKETKEVLGQEVTATVVKNKVSRAWQTAEWQFLYQEDGSGKFDVVGGTLDLLCELGIIEKSGARVKWDGKSLFRKQVIEDIEKNGRVDELMGMLPQ